MCRARSEEPGHLLGGLARRFPEFAQLGAETNLACSGLVVDTAELLASELVSNAVLHTRGPACLRLRFRDGILQIGAWDADP